MKFRLFGLVLAYHLETGPSSQKFISKLTGKTRFCTIYVMPQNYITYDTGSQMNLLLLQNDLNKAIKWSKENRLEFNNAKFEAI